MKLSKSEIRFNIFGYITLTTAAIACLLPFLLVISASLTDENSIRHDGYNLIPKVFSTDAYKAILKYPKDLINSYTVSISITIIGALVGLFLMAMTAYVLQRKDFKYRNSISFFFYFTTLFSGGLVPFYILMVRYLNLKDSLLSLILPGLMSAFYILLLRNFMKSIPDSISESAKIDRAGDFTIFLKLYLPLSKPGLTTVGLFLALGYWNDWFLASLFINSRAKFPLQFLLYQYLTNFEVMKSLANSGLASSSITIPTESLKMATAVIATGPIVALYPFAQKYFIRGLTIGAVKG